MHRAPSASKKHLPHAQDYSAFDQLDGTHPWQQATPESCVMYPVRVLPGGKVSYFNFSLAKEMGLIPPHHSHLMNRRLEEKLLETFCIRIINEWDQAHNVIVPKAMMKRNKYMATRYLQLQHPDKTGRTSGDGRCIWNGIVRFQGQTWDVSSRGTGVTQLAPGAVLAGKPLRSGNKDHGYGCGLAEIDELYAAAIMAEIFHKNHIPTERVLAIIDLGNGFGIGVRAGRNLLRPAHLFAHIKQNNFNSLKRTVDYFIERQERNGRWPTALHRRRRYDFMIRHLTQDFARFAAILEREYIFAWLDWDGDNVLLDAGLIDYGSVRQFGLRHDQYRYGDLDRFSTNLNEQKVKTRQIIQTLAQVADYLKSGTKKPLSHFSGHRALKVYDQEFKFHLLNHFLYQLGFLPEQRTTLLKRHQHLVRSLYRQFNHFERAKTRQGLRRVADGINRPAIYNMRAVIGHLPDFFLEKNAANQCHEVMEDKAFFQLMISKNAPRRDRKHNRRLLQRIRRFQKDYRRLLEKALGRKPSAPALKILASRASRINREDRITGNALIHIVDELLRARRKGLPDMAIQQVMDAFIEDQILDPDIQLGKETLLPDPSKSSDLLSTVLHLAQGHREEI